MNNFVAKSVVRGSNVKVWHYAVIQDWVVLCDDCSIGSGTEIGKDSVIGPRSRIGAHVFLPKDTIVGADVFIGPGTVATDDRYPKVNNPGYKAEPPRFKDGCSVGAGCVILPGVTIGEGALVGAGSVVTHDVPPKAIIYGPAATIKGLRPD